MSTNRENEGILFRDEKRIMNNDNRRISQSDVGPNRLVDRPIYYKEFILHSLSTGGNNSHKATIIRLPPRGIKECLFISLWLK